MGATGACLKVWETSEGNGCAGAVRLQGVWQGGEMDEEEVVCCPGRPVESPPDPSFKQAFFSLLFKNQ